MFKSYTIAWLLIFGLGASSQAFANNLVKPLQDKTKVALQLKWTHQFQFAGYYMAQAKGFYADAGLEVDIRQASVNTNPIEEVTSGRADFGVGTSELLLRYSQGQPVVVLGVIFQHSPLALLALENSNLDLITDLEGKNLMIEKNSSEIFALLQQSNIDRNNINIVQHSLNIDDLLNQRIDAMTVYTTTEVYELFKLKIPYRLFTPRMAGIDFYGDNFFTNAETIQSDPETVEAFRKASVEGWKYAMSHIDETIEYIATNYPNRSRDQLKFEAATMQSLMRTDLIEPGHMSAKRWNHIYSVYKELGLIPKDISLDAFLYQHDKLITRLESKVSNLFFVVLSFALISLIALWAFQRFYRVKRQLSTMVEQAPLAILLIDDQFRVKEWNHQAELTFGWQAQDVFGQNIFDFLVLNVQKQIVKETLQQVLTKQKPVHHENKNYHKNGHELSCNWSNSPIIIEGKKYIICMALDTSELRDLKAASMHKDIFIANKSSDEMTDFLSELVQVMQLCLTIWEESTSQSKAQFAEQSQLWRVSLDGGTAKTRTLDKYLSVETIPQKPRWKNVINSANFICRTFPNHSEMANLIELKNKISPPK